MPKIVDHDQRRLELVDATWRIIARRGMEGATMRDIAVEAGFSNGALKPYFPTKDDLLTFAFRHVFNRTNQRIALSTFNQTGTTAIRALGLEVLPVDEEKVSEARIVIPFWQKAITDSHKMAIHRESMAQWRLALMRHLGEARQAGAITTGVPDDVVREQLMNLFLGAQITAALTGPEESLPSYAHQLDGFLANL
ncbi:TetR/AcrR family transcriptional regulator [Arthrobacter crusticola]|uniref:TetR/AcrR family transcriptional regulator n=1 Tax=Arthrobacter crusticola TaxID=2547960 RepID=A0A4R5U2V1_9MICC|nr:TetR/AcrR family transcriptional regulator [Arthrobacter crusticola]TDK27986.1 TetR/AcrR family transcriptional regulator [Arthrobacter crusticola]